MNLESSLSDSKNCCGFVVDEFTKLVLTIKPGSHMPPTYLRSSRRITSQISAYDVHMKYFHPRWSQVGAFPPTRLADTSTLSQMRWNLAWPLFEKVHIFWCCLSVFVLPCDVINDVKFWRQNLKFYFWLKNWFRNFFLWKLCILVKILPKSVKTSLSYGWLKKFEFPAKWPYMVKIKGISNLKTINIWTMK